MPGATRIKVQSLKSKVQRPRLKGWIRPTEMAAFAQRQLKVSLICLLAAIALLTVGHRAFQSFSASSQTTSLSAPANVTATDNAYSMKVAVEWNAVPGASLYRIFRNTTNNSATATALGTTPQALFFDVTGAPNQALFYWVRAENGANVGGLSQPDQGSRNGANIQGPIPPLNPPPAPPGNAVTAAKAYLGKALFWDEQLSSTRTVACGTCHFATSGGSDARSIINSTQARNPGVDAIFNTADDVFASPGVISNNSDGTYNWSPSFGFGEQVTGRKSRSYVDAGYSNTLFWDGRATATFTDPIGGGVVLANGAALESQVLGPPVSSAEMAHVNRNWNDVAVRVLQSEPLALSPSVPAALNDWIGGRSYAQLFEEAFGTPEITPARIAMAIATFERTVFSDRTRFDQAVQQIVALSAEETRGRGVFNQSGCAACHAGSLFSDNAFHNIGVRPPAEDTGRFQVTGNPNDMGEFRTPSLRNVALRGPFMHNGRLATLEDVVDFYNRGGDFDAPNINRNLIRPLNLSPQQRSDLVAFLRTLTDARVAAGAAPFDRPMLYSESSRVPQIVGNGTTGTGGIVPQVTAIQPPVVGNPSFSVGISQGLGGAQAVLVVHSSDPGIGPPPATASFNRSVISLAGNGAGQGFGSISLQIPNDSALPGSTFYGRWYVADSNAIGGTAVSPLFQFTVFGAAAAPNPIDDAQGFVRQHYQDFLNRDADASGLAFWTNDIAACGTDAACIEVKRINVSAAFFLSIEFQNTGYLVERLYKTAYGDATGVSTLGGTHSLPVPVVRLNEFLADTQEIGNDVVVNQPGWEQLLENNKQAFALAFVQRTRFTSAFQTTLTPTEFVDRLNSNAGNVLSASERTTLINLFAGAANSSDVTARAQAVRAVAEDQDLLAAEYNRAFVLMQYFGYLRRNPNDGQDTDYTGYDFWLTKLTQFNGNFADAEMVRSFIVSNEYRNRF